MATITTSTIGALSNTDNIFVCCASDCIALPAFQTAHSLWQLCRLPSHWREA